MTRKASRGKPARPSIVPAASGETQGPGAIAGKSDSRIFRQPDESSADSAGGPSGIPVVGLGGSAGSLRVFEAFFGAMPADSGAAFVIIQHLAPDHASLLPELVAQHTSMTVVQAQDAVPVERNCVYVIPPNQYLGIRDGILFLSEPVKQDGIRMPIDFFFRSLAEDRQQQAIGILFSGAGSDGTLGVRAIRGGGGLTIAQEPITAQFDTMPRSAIATGLVDFVLPPDRIPGALLEYLRHPYVRGGEPASVLEGEAKPEGVQSILSLVLAQTGCDFRCYKKSTILRRIERRMGLHRISDLAQYGTLLSRDAHEVGELQKDLLINVTSFFRDPEAFVELRDKAVRPLLEARQSDEPLRIWVPGCASGEEAYSLAMLLTEEVVAASKNRPIQVFATDIDEDALRAARLGIYPESIAADVEPDRLTKFFIRRDAGCQISESLRKSIVFAAQNLMTDPPFSRMDLISCRNLLIYLDAEAQTKLMPLFNFALNPGGYLFLGKSEGIGGRSDLFELVSKRARLYRRLAPARPLPLDSPILPGRKRAIATAVFRPPAASLTDVIRQALLGHFSASIVLVDRKGQILQFHGQTGKYLNMPTAEPNLNLLEVAKPGLSLQLRSAMHRAIEEGTAAVLESVSVTREEGGPFVRVTVAPAPQRGDAEPLLAVIFEDVPRPAIVAVALPQTRESETVVRRLEDELKAAQQDLQSTIDDLQSSNEELRVANEEVISSNEELQSTNEELETSKEELQSVNEELTTVNNQLQEKVLQLDTANSDMANLLKSSEIATLFLDNELRIKFFTPAMTRVLNLIPADMGRPITHLSMDLVGCDLAADARASIQDASIMEREVRHANGSSYLVRIAPYRTQMEQVDGVVITLIDLTNLRCAEKQLADVVESSNDAILALTLDGAILTWNRAAEAIFGYSAEEVIGYNTSMLAPPDQMTEAAELVARIKQGESITALETQRVRKDGRTIDVALSLSPMRDAAGRIGGISTVARDITDRKRAEAELRTHQLHLEELVRQRTSELEQAAEELARSNRDLDQFASVASHDLQEPLRTVSGFVQLLQNKYANRLDAEANTFIKQAAVGAKRMEALIKDLLAFARVGTRRREPVPIDAGTSLRQALDNLHESIRETGTEITHGELPTVRADPSQLAQLFQNLLGNALKFRSDAPPKIHLDARREGDAWQFSVRDNGIGIDPKFQAQIFDAFRRLHAGERYEGTGIGLAICKKIVENHGGRIWVESQFGQGATFHFTLPV
ncbi:MAG: chemotaxis protein CheB [Thermoguttaceae bacterium]